MGAASAPVKVPLHSNSLRCRDGLGRARSTYVRRRPEDTVLHQVVREHLETFLAEARLRGGGEGLPRFVERELREFLTCGVLAEGFARFRCTDCEREILVAFSCKGRGFCPSCCGRRMAELAAHLVDGVLGGLPVRQWVLTLPYRLRYALAWDHQLCRAVLGVFMRAVLGFERRRAERRGIPDGAGGAVTAIQRFGSALNTNVHFHTLVVQGVFIEGAEGPRRFLPLPAPTDGEVARVLASVRRRIIRLVGRHGVDLEEPSGEAQPFDERLFECPMYAAIQGAAVLGRVATGPRAGGPVQRVGRDRYAAEITSTGHCTPTSRASICMRGWPCRRATGSGWNIYAATSCARPLRRSAWRWGPTARCCCGCGGPGATARVRFGLSRASSSRSSRR